MVIGRFVAAGSLVAFTTLGGAFGCAHGAGQQGVADAQKNQIVTLQARLDEAERTNGRLTVRVEELEDSVFLLQDRVDANRIALQRRGAMGDQYAQGRTYGGPAPATETYYRGTQQPQGDSYGYDERGVTGQQPGANVTRIPLESREPADSSGYLGPEPSARQEYAEQVPVSQGPYAAQDAELVINEDAFAAFEASSPPPRKSKSSSSTAAVGAKKAQDPVTAERLPTTQELETGQAPTPTEKKKARSALATYKDGLADYRSGNYSGALTSFEEFLASSPQPDYMDNALYWIGECHYGLGQFEDAVKFFQKVMSEQPDGNKVPDAMLKMSLAFDRVGRGEEATKLLQDLTRQYPATNAGRLATQKLEERK